MIAASLYCARRSRTATIRTTPGSRRTGPRSSRPAWTSSRSTSCSTASGPAGGLPYLNFYVGNGCVIVPLACLPCDREGLERMPAVFPDREVVGVPATNLARRGGGAHCITLQQSA